MNRPLKRINPSYENPFSIFPVATTVLAICLPLTLLALIYIQFLMPTAI